MPRPYLASKIWGVIQLTLSLVILLLCRFQFGPNLPAFFVFLGYAFWAVFCGIVHKGNPVS